MQRKLLPFLITFIMITAACRTDDPTDYDAWDVDRDETLSSTEFFDAYNTLGYYRKWDSDGDGHLDANEWEQGMENTFPNQNDEFYNKFQAWDLNADGWLSDEEFVNNSFSAFDTNNDGVIDREEFNYWFEQRE